MTGKFKNLVATQSYEAGVSAGTEVLSRQGQSGEEQPFLPSSVVLL